MALLDLDDLITAATPTDFQTKILSICSSLGLKTTAWQSGGVTRTIIAVVSKILGVVAGTSTNGLAAAGVDGLVATIARGGYLRLAGAVTPDPSLDPTVAPGWLDLLAENTYNVERSPAHYATGSVDLINASTSSYGPFAAGTYHLANVTKKTTYSNVSALTITAGSMITASFRADVAGSASTTAASALTPVTSLVGVTVDSGQTGVLQGSNAESNDDLVERCLDKLATLAPFTGPRDVYEYFARNATDPVVDGGGGLTLAGGPITRVRTLLDLSTYPGSQKVYLGNASGAPSSPDVSAVDAWIQGSCVPNCVNVVTEAAVADPLTVVIDSITVPTSVSEATARAAAIAAVEEYVATCPIGGVITSTGPDVYAVPLSEIVGAATSISYVRAVGAVTINAVAADHVISAPNKLPTVASVTVTTVLRVP